MLEVEQASMNTEANARLAQIRSELGIAPAAAPGDELLKQAEQLQQADGGAKGQVSPGATEPSGS